MWPGVAELPALRPGLVRTATRKDAVHVLSDSRPGEVGGTDIDGVVDPVPGSGSTGGNIAGSEASLPSMESASPPSIPRSATLPWQREKFL